jgi:hypothetical protein
MQDTNTSKPLIEPSFADAEVAIKDAPNLTKGQRRALDVLLANHRQGAR